MKRGMRTIWIETRGVPLILRGLVIFSKFFMSVSYILRFMMLHCYSKKNNPVSLALRAFQSYENFPLYPNSASVLKLS